MRKYITRTWQRKQIKHTEKPPSPASVTNTTPGNLTFSILYFYNSSTYTPVCLSTQLILFFSEWHKSDSMVYMQYSKTLSCSLKIQLSSVFDCGSSVFLCLSVASAPPGTAIKQGSAIKKHTKR